VLQRRLIAALLVALATITGCGDEPIEDNLVRPGITAIEEARSEACGMNASTLRTAIEAYSMLEGDPPPDEQALIDAGFLREATADWNVVDGELVAENPACGDVGAAPVPPTVVDIVTDTAAISAEELLADMTDEQVEQVGGADCARELAAIVAAGQRFFVEREEEPTGFEDLVDAGYLDGLPGLWAITEDRLVPVAGSGCIDLETTSESDDDTDCGSEARTLEVAFQAYRAMNGPDAVPTERDLVEAGMLRDESELVDLDAQGNVVAAPGSGCEGLLDE